jgi:hypothetical protein
MKKCPDCGCRHFHRVEEMIIYYDVNPDGELIEIDIEKLDVIYEQLVCNDCHGSFDVIELVEDV